MASISTPDPEFFYAIAYIMFGSAIVLSLLRFISLDTKPSLSTGRAKPLARAARYINEQCLKVLSVSDPLSPPPAPSSRGYLEGLPPRVGPRPDFAGTSNPHQTTHLPCSSKEVSTRLHEAITDVCARYPASTYLGRSTFEPAGPTTLFARHRAFDKTRYYGQILGADKVHGFVHCTLHPSDVRLVLEKGWAQRHPLSTRAASWWLRLQGDEQQFQFGPTPSSQVLLYAPRDQADLDVVTQIVDAAVWWVGGVGSTVDVESC